jgi:nitroimidazol reductase NimA-like FMN-containing flavoprotein (pyridoxamine 5'-phosphate oxidase superfamily)
MQESKERHPHGPMRRKDREITNRSEIDAILHSANLMRIALADGDTPFLVPVFYAFDGVAIYFHSAQTGTKIEIMKRNDKVCFEVSLDHGIIENDIACDFEVKHRTVIGFGRIAFVVDEAEKIKALDRIVERFSEKKFEYPKANLSCTTVIRIDIESIKGKKHGVY